MDVRKARRISNDDIRDERFVSRVAHDRDHIRRDILISTAKAWRGPKTIASLDTGSPASHNYLFDALSSLRNLSILQRIDTGHQARILDHKSHKFSGITSNGEEFQAILLDKFLKCGVGGHSNAVAVGILQD